jgi:hypothetical protein
MPPPSAVSPPIGVGKLLTNPPVVKATVAGPQIVVPPLPFCRITVEVDDPEFQHDKLVT